MNALTIDRIVVGEMKENAYIVTHVSPKSRNAFIIDPGDDWEYLSACIEKRQCRVKCILLTHGHFDHVMAAFPLAYLYKIPVFLDPKDLFLVKRLSSTAKKFVGKNIGDLPAPETEPFDEALLSRFFEHETIHVLPVPGHTPGSVAIQVGTNIFSGDTVFAGGATGRTDFSYGDNNALRDSVKKILSFPGDYVVYPGHGEFSTVRDEREIHGV